MVMFVSSILLSFTLTSQSILSSVSYGPLQDLRAPPSLSPQAGFKSVVRKKTQTLANGLLVMSSALRALFLCSFAISRSASEYRSQPDDHPIYQNIQDIEDGTNSTNYCNRLLVTLSACMADGTCYKIVSFHYPVSPCRLNRRC